MFEVARKMAVESGFATMLVKTEATNERALRCYKEKGFREDGKIVEESNNEKVDLTVLKLSLRKT